jgi:hypothetical protein
LSDIIAHHQEHLNCIYNFWIYSRLSSAAVMAHGSAMTTADNDTREENQKL